MANINAQELQNIKIPIPPLALQNAFGTVVEQMESTRVTLRADLADAKRLSDSLSQRAFRGEL
jgi:type I restriction enzyme S subunit